jgi:ferredoxin-type protein NapH
MRIRARRWVQTAAAVAANPWFVYLGTRSVYQGRLKGVCFPGLNCHACPLALFSCPIGALQRSVATLSPRGAFGSGAAAQGWTARVAPLLYVVGFVGLVGVVFGRLPCGWICPFGFLQDLLYRIPTPKFRLPSWTRFFKYASLGVLALMAPYLSRASTFCRVCPAGALEGALPLKLLPPDASLPATGWFFWFKIAVLVIFLAWMVVTKRPFCRTACPLGAAYALLAPVSLFRMDVDLELCTGCDKCRNVCPVDIRIYENPNSPECIRCLDCKKACPEGAITSGFSLSAGAGGTSTAQQ